MTDELNVPYNGKTIVVTHHVPTRHNYPPSYADSNINEAFAVELEELILKTRPDYWIYGHYHHNVPDFPIWMTRLLTNQVGYVMNNEQISFDPGKFIEI